MNNLYIRVINDIPEYTPYTLEQVKRQIYFEQNAILPAELSETLLNYFNFYTAVVKIIPLSETKLGLYSTTEIKQIYKDNNSWCIEFEQVLKESLVEEAWFKVRQERNNLLLNTDWIETSNIVTSGSKERYYAYRQVLRDIININEYPCDVVFPMPPNIEYVSEVQFSNRPILTEEQVEVIKNYPDISANWYMFLTQWSNLNFCRDRSIVSNLIITYTNTALGIVLGDSYD